MKKLAAIPFILNLIGLIVWSAIAFYSWLFGGNALWLNFPQQKTGLLMWVAVVCLLAFPALPFIVDALEDKFLNK